MNKIIILFVLAVIAGTTGFVNKGKITEANIELEEVWVEVMDGYMERNEMVRALLKKAYESQGRSQEFLLTRESVNESLDAIEPDEYTLAILPDFKTFERAQATLSYESEKMIAMVDGDVSMRDDAGFKRVKKDIEAMNGHLKKLRAVFEQKAKRYNSLVTTFPSNLVAEHYMNVKPKGQFELPFSKEPSSF